MNWDYNQHKHYENDQMRKAQNERMAREAKEDRPRRRTRFNR